MNINIADLKNKIIYRSQYRGSKEMDVLLSSFTQKYINTFNNKELLDLAYLVNLDDENLLKFNQGQKTEIKIKKNKVSKLFSEYIYGKT
ncbi:succinate dehydrogenase assembly factor 2 [Candidatus Pelagibacter sp.]|nr:succinate dehydrogenase assembly factor 2 [Candidatus Pelagibacter sp.]